jgi:hypothetical protein
MDNGQKDLMITFRTTIVGQNKKGGDRLQLFLNNDQAEALHGALADLLNDAGTTDGIKLDIHTSDRERNDGSGSFKSTIAFVKAAQPSKKNAPAPRTFVPAPVSQAPSNARTQVANKLKRTIS